MAVNILQDTLYRSVLQTQASVDVAEFEPHSLTKMKIKTRVFLFFSSVAHRYHGQIGANLILGGVDCTGNHLYKVGPYGSVDKVPYLSMGMHAVALREEFLYKYAVYMKLCIKFIGGCV